MLIHLMHDAIFFIRCVRENDPSDVFGIAITYIKSSLSTNHLENYVLSKIPRAFFRATFQFTGILGISGISGHLHETDHCSDYNSRPSHV